MVPIALYGRISFGGLYRLFLVRLFRFCHFILPQDLAYPESSPFANNCAFIVIFLLMYLFHQHPTRSPVIPPLSKKALHITSQTLFFTGAVSAGCYLIFITNKHGYYAVMKQSPPLGCLWIWSVVELDLVPAVGSLLWCVVFLKWGGYDYL